MTTKRLFLFLAPALLFLLSVASSTPASAQQCTGCQFNVDSSTPIIVTEPGCSLFATTRLVGGDGICFTSADGCISDPCQYLASIRVVALGCSTSVDVVTGSGGLVSSATFDEEQSQAGQTVSVWGTIPCGSSDAIRLLATAANGGKSGRLYRMSCSQCLQFFTQPN
ncbi:MAG: hypothetical protein AAFZ87_11520 [Planctomycetota bacterium]